MANSFASSRQSSAPIKRYDPSAPIIVLEPQFKADVIGGNLELQAHTSDQLGLGSNLGLFGSTVANSGSDDPLAGDPVSGVPTILPPDASVVVIGYQAPGALANELIERGHDTGLVRFVDVKCLKDHAPSLEDFVETYPDKIRGMIAKAKDPILFDVVRPIHEYPDLEPPRMYGNGGLLPDHELQWRAGSLVIWTGAYGAGKTTTAAITSFRSMLSPEGMEDHTKCALWAMEDELTEFKERLARFVLAEKALNPTKEDLDRLYDFQNRVLWWSDDMPRPKGLNDWIEKTERLYEYHGVTIHLLDPWSAHIPDLNHGATERAYIQDRMIRLSELAHKNKLIIHITTHVTKEGSSRARELKQLYINDAANAADFGRFADVGLVTLKTPRLASLLSGAFDASDSSQHGIGLSDNDIIEARKKGAIRNPTGFHTILGVDKLKNRTMGKQQTVALVLDPDLNNFRVCPAATYLIQRLWTN